MLTLTNLLDLDRCPHCQVDRPSLPVVAAFQTSSHTGDLRRAWKVYACSRCGGCVLASAAADLMKVLEVYPAARAADPNIPDRAREYLNQAIRALSAPAGAVMLAASAVDAMLKCKGLLAGSLYARIDKAAADHVITPEMALWAHEVRLDANDQRHADQDATMPTDEDARNTLEFSLALAEFLFVLPARITRGRQASPSSDTPAAT